MRECITPFQSLIKDQIKVCVCVCVCVSLSTMVGWFSSEVLVLTFLVES